MILKLCVAKVKGISRLITRGLQLIAKGSKESATIVASWGIQKPNVVMKGGGKEQRCKKCNVYGHLAEACRKEFAGAIQVQYCSKQAQDGDTRTEFDRSLKTVKGRVGKYVVNTLRDSGCTTICVDRKFIDDDQLTGEYKKCKLIVDTERKLMTAVADVDIPYLTKRQVTVVCMDNPTSDLVIGNVDVAACKCSPKSDWTPGDSIIRAAAIQAQEKAGKKAVNHPIVKDIEKTEIDVTPAMLKQPSSEKQENGTLGRTTMNKLNEEIEKLKHEKHELGKVLNEPTQKMRQNEWTIIGQRKRCFNCGSVQHLIKDCKYRYKAFGWN